MGCVQGKGCGGLVLARGGPWGLGYAGNQVSRQCCWEGEGEGSVNGE